MKIGDIFWDDTDNQTDVIYILNVESDKVSYKLAFKREIYRVKCSVYEFSKRFEKYHCESQDW
jgi:hypothetical protein